MAALGGGVVLPVPPVPPELPPPLPPHPETPRLAAVMSTRASHSDGPSFLFLVKRDPQAIRLAQTTRPEVPHGEEFSFFEDARDVRVRKLDRSAGAGEVHIEPTPMLSVAAFWLLDDGLIK